MNPKQAEHMIRLLTKSQKTSESILAELVRLRRLSRRIMLKKAKVKANRKVKRAAARKNLAANKPIKTNASKLTAEKRPAKPKRKPAGAKRTGKKI